jgi:hypothetical protein
VPLQRKGSEEKGGEVRSSDRSADAVKIANLDREFDHLGEIAKIVGDLRGPRTVIHELIQNADDAPGASRMRFTVGPGSLAIWNDGKFSRCSDITTKRCEWLARLRHRCDFHSFRSLGSGDKRNRPGTTGAFGIGFNAVYQLTDRPELISNGVHWLIDEMDEDARIKQRPAPADHSGTTFILPWARETSDFRTVIRQEAVTDADIAGFLTELEEAIPRAMLFLKKLKILEINGEIKPIIFRRTIPREAGSDRIVIKSSAGSRWTWQTLQGDFADRANELKKQYPNQIEAERSDKVTMAFPLDDASDAGVLHASLPTEESSHLPLVINADFFPASDRKRIRFDDAPESEFNRSAIRAASSLLTTHLERLPQLLGDKRFVGLLIKAQELNRRIRAENIDPSFDNFWRDIVPALPSAAVVPTANGQRQRTSTVRLWRDAVELAAAPVLASIGVLLVHEDRRDDWYQLRSQELGLQELALGDVAASLQTAGITRRLPLADLPGQLASEAGRASLLAVAEQLLASGRANQESRGELRRCAIAPASDRACWPFEQLQIAEEGTRRVFDDVGIHLVYLDTSALGAGHPQLSGLVPAIDVPFALDRFGKATVAGTLRHDFDPGRVLAWFHDREGELGQSEFARLASLPVFPTAAGPRPLNGLALPGDFSDPLGVAQLVVVDNKLEDLKPFLRKLGALPLTFSLYCRKFVPGAVNGGQLENARRWKLLELLVSRWSQIRDDEHVRTALTPLALLPCTDNGWRSAADVYVASNEIKQILGAQATFAAFPPGKRTSYEELYTWLGAATEPRPADLIARCFKLIAAPSGSRETAAGIIQYLGKRYKTDPAKVGADYAKLKEIGWLPAEGGRKGSRPDAIFGHFRRKLFESQGTFLDIPPTAQDEAADFLRWLGVKTEPEPIQVVAHLLWCSQNQQNVSELVWIYLNQHAADSALEALLSQQCLQLDNRKFVRPADVYWGDHPFGRWRYRLGPKFRAWQALLDRLQVAQGPEPRDAIDVLQDIAATHGGEPAPLLAEDIPVVQNCWKLLTGGLAARSVTPSDLSSLRNDEVVLDGRNWLRTPLHVFFRDSVSLADRFDEGLHPRLIDRPEGMWPALAGAGVRNLSDAVDTHVVEADDESAEGPIGRLLRSRRMLLLRVLGHDPDATQKLDDFYLRVDIRHLIRLEIQQSIEIDGEYHTTAPYPRAALYQPGREILRCVDQAATLWVELAREFIRAVRIDSAQPAALASAVRSVLQAANNEAAARELDELGFAALDAASVAHVEGSVAEGLGRSDEQGADTAELTDRDHKADIESLAESSQNGLGADSPDDGADIGELGRDGGSRTTAPHGSSGQYEAGTGTYNGDGQESSTSAPASGSGQTQLRSYVAPARSKAPEDQQTQSDNDRAVERAGVDAVMAYERMHGRRPSEMPRMNEGFDVTSQDGEGRIRTIEVKATAIRWGERGVALSKPQYRTAQERREEFWLYVVENALSSPKVHPINDPASKIGQYFFDDGWRADAVIETVGRPTLQPLNLAAGNGPGAVPYFDAGNPHVALPGDEDGWLICADARRRDNWFAVRITGYGLGMAFYGGVAYVEPMEGIPEDGERVLVELHGQIDPDSGTHLSLRRWSPERDLAGNQLALRLSSDGSVEPLTVLDPGRATVHGRVAGTIRPVDVGGDLQSQTDARARTRTY